MSKSLPFLSMMSIPLTAVVALSACTKSFDASVKESVVEAVQVNRDAKSMLEWETSEAHPEHFFEKARKNDSPETRQQICEQLQALPGAELILFEDSIKDTKNSELLTDCKQTLLKAIEDHWENERQEMEKAGMSTISEAGTIGDISGGDKGSSLENVRVNHAGDVPVFNTEIQYRDLSKGYYGYRGDVKHKQVILTFDDGPDAKYTPVILKTLRESGVKAIFFHCGNRVDARPDIVQAVAADGHSIGSHTYAHSYIGPYEKCGGDDCRKHWLNTQQAMSVIRQGHESIVKAIGWVDPFFRFPYGAHTAELRQFLKDTQTGEFFWSVDSLDWKAGYSNLQTIKSVMDQLEKDQKGMLLFHDVQRKTAEILPQILKELYARGYQPVVLQSSDSEARTNSRLVESGLD